MNTLIHTYVYMYGSVESYEGKDLTSGITKKKILLLYLPCYPISSVFHLPSEYPG